VQVVFAVGKANKDYADYRKLTAAEWKDAAVGARLLAAHASGGGWSLLEEPLRCNGTLCVAKEYVRVDGAVIAEVGHNKEQELRGRYSAMNSNTKAPWTAAAPSLRRWDVRPRNIGNRPCLYIRQVRGAAHLPCVFCLFRCRRIFPDMYFCTIISLILF